MTSATGLKTLRLQPAIPDAGRLLSAESDLSQTRSGRARRTRRSRMPASERVSRP